MNWMAVIGDALWIVCLSFIAGASRTTWRRVVPGATIPFWGLGEKPMFRLPKAAGLLMFPIFATALGLVLSAMARKPTAYPMQLLVLLGVRTLLAPMVVMSHLGHLRAATELLQAEGKLKP